MTRPRAPSPPRSLDEDEDDLSTYEDDEYGYSDNTYSVVQDQLEAPPPPPKKKTAATAGAKAGAASAGRMYVKNNSAIGRQQQQRLFGDSVNPSPAESVLSSGSSGGIASLYHARNTGPRKMYDAATVEEIKAQFQQQIESMLQSQERNKEKSKPPMPPPPPPQQQQQQSLIKTGGHIPSSADRELSGIRGLERGKSFDEARTAVQKQIERMFSDATSTGQPPHVLKKDIKHTMHGVSHAIPGDDDEIQPPPPVHYGVNDAIRNGVNNKTNKWQSVESLLSTSTSAATSTITSSSASKGEKSRVKFSGSMENVRPLGLNKTSLVDIDLDEPIRASERMRKFKMENGKSMPDLRSTSSVSSAGKKSCRVQ